MTDIRISDMAEITGLSMRYWQRRVMSGEVPGGQATMTNSVLAHRRV